MDQLKAIFAVKLKLAMRSDTNKSYEGALRGIFIVLMAFLVVYFGFTVGWMYRTTETEYDFIRKLLFPGIHWLLGLLWLFVPVSPMGMSQSIHFEGLSLFPINRRIFVGSMIVNALATPSGLIVPLIIAVTTFTFGKTPLLAGIAFIVSLLFWTGLLVTGQLILLVFGRILASRRFADIALIIGTLIGFLFYFSRFFFYTETLNNPDVLNTFDRFKPLGIIARFFPPGLAGWSFNSAATGNWTEFAVALGILAVELFMLIWLAGIAVDKFFVGELSLGGVVSKKATARIANGQAEPQSSDSFINRLLTGFGLSTSVAALFMREWRYLLREPIYKLRLMNSLFVFVYLFGMYFMLKHDGTFEPAHLNIAFSIFAYFSIMWQFKLAANKFGIDGEAIESLLITPVKRTDIMLAKTLIGLLVYQGTSIVILLLGSIFLRIELALMPLLAIAMITGALIVEAGGNVIGVNFPYKVIRSSGRRGVPQYEQGGCTFQLVYSVSNTAVGAIALPLAAAVVVPFYMGVTFLGYIIAPAVIAIAVSLLRYSLSYSAKRLEIREQPIIELLTKQSN